VKFFVRLISLPPFKTCTFSIAGTGPEGAQPPRVSAGQTNAANRIRLIAPLQGL
jgi:hypothetical protein